VIGGILGGIAGSFFGPGPGTAGGVAVGVGVATWVLGGAALGGAAGNLIEETGKISCPNIFSEGDKGGNGKKAKSKEKSIRSLRDRIREHEDKLARYKKNPDAYDNQGYLKNAPNETIRQKIIEKRIRHLEHEINTFKKNILDLGGTP
jgi:predicted RNase H-like nuclease (RuvC/YqgF family)